MDNQHNYATTKKLGYFEFQLSWKPDSAEKKQKSYPEPPNLIDLTMTMPSNLLYPPKESINVKIQISNIFCQFRQCYGINIVKKRNSKPRLYETDFKCPCFKKDTTKVTSFLETNIAKLQKMKSHRRSQTDLMK